MPEIPPLYCWTDLAEQMSRCEPSENLAGLPPAGFITVSQTAPVFFPSPLPQEREKMGDFFAEEAPLDLTLQAQSFLMMATFAYQAKDTQTASLYLGQAGEAYGLVGRGDLTLYYFRESVRILEEDSSIPQTDNPQLFYARAQLADFEAQQALLLRNHFDYLNQESLAVENYCDVLRLLQEETNGNPDPDQQQVQREVRAHIARAINRAQQEKRYNEASIYLGIWQEVDDEAYSPTAASILFDLQLKNGELGYRSTIRSHQEKIDQIDQQVVQLSQQLERSALWRLPEDSPMAQQLISNREQEQIQDSLQALTQDRHQLLDEIDSLEKRGKVLQDEIRRMVELNWGPVEPDTELFFQRELFIARAYRQMEELSASNEMLRSVQATYASIKTMEAQEKALSLLHELARYE
ncbi:MAG: hypothetical protein Q7S00_00065, partial [bacterium]|nr:hypothetical protein [bacterium]